MEEEPKNITTTTTNTDEPKGAGVKRKPRTKKDGNTDQRSLKNQKNMSHARSELQKYIHEGKKIKTKKEVATEGYREPEEEEEEDIEVIFKSPKVKQPEEKENKKNKVKELEELIGRYHSELSRISEKHKKLKKKKVSTTPPPPSPTPLPPTPYSSIGNDLRKKFLLRF